MTRPARRLLVLLVAAASLAASGCSKDETAIVGDTEGIYVTVDELKYQVQISRILNPADIEDRAYLKGVPEGEAPTAEEVWFAIFMRVENDTGETHEATDSFAIKDTQENEYEPLELDPEENLFAYESRPVPPGTLIPATGSTASDSTIQGALLLFKVKTESLYNRPLELDINSTQGGDNALVGIDV